MTDSIHIIRSQEYEIIYDDQGDVHRLQNSISGLQHSRIDTLLEKDLNKFDSNDFVYQFNTIELNLGSLRKLNYENELVYRIEEEFTKYLRYNILENGRLRDGVSISTSNRMLEDLEFYLQNGHFKWNSTSKTKPPAYLLT